VLLIAFVALIPGLVSWWDSRALKRRLDDPTLPERLHAARVRRGAAFGMVLVFLAVLSYRAMVWSLPLMVAGLLVPAYSLRRALFGETWTLRGYAWFFIRLTVAIWAFWILLVATFWLAAAAGSLDWVVAGAMAILLLAYNAHYAQTVRFVLRTRPIDDPVLIARFGGLVEKSGIPIPRFERVPLEGGAIANALALPSLDRSSVLFSDTLLERLEADETVAICAHELAHLEHFNPTFLRRINIENIVLIVSAALVPLVTRLAGLSSFIPHGLWFVGFAILLVRRAQDRQRNETVSDLRAIELCGDAEALVRGLTRLYTMARLPRRFDQQHERQASHPSLARRIRDIRAAAGIATQGLGAAATFAAPEGKTSVTFDEETLDWREGEGVTHRLKYAFLAELRVQARGSRPSTLVAVEREGRRWEMLLAHDDLARAQAVLDIVDGRLPEPPAPPSAWPKVGRAFIALAGMVGLASGQLAFALVALLAILQPAAPLMAAVGVAAMAAAAVLLRNSGFEGVAFTELALMLGGFGALLLFVARTKRDEPLTSRARLCVGGLGVCATLAVTLFFLGGMDPIRLHQSAQSVTAAPVLLLAFAGALTLWRTKPAKYAAIPVLVLAAATTGVASTSFLDRFGRDVFIAPTPALTWTHADGPQLMEFVVPVTGESLRLSPRGQLFAVVQTDYDADGDDAVKMTAHIGRAGGRVASVHADDFLFVDEEQLLLLRSHYGAVELMGVRVDAPDQVLWRVEIPNLHQPSLSLDAETRQWRVIGWNEERQIVAVRGTLGSVAFVRQEWIWSTDESGFVKSVSASQDKVVVVAAHYKPGLLQRCGLWQFAWLVQPDPETQFRFSSPTEGKAVVSSRLETACYSGALKRERLLCSAFDGTRTRFISLDPASEQIRGVGWMDGRYLATGSPSNGWLSGWRQTTPFALNVERGLAVYVERKRDDRIFAVTGGDEVIGTMSYNGAGSTIRLIRLSNLESSSARAAR
jgi:Zn-dependent protease with chaperone function